MIVFVEIRFNVKNDAVGMETEAPRKWHAFITQSVSQGCGWGVNTTRETVLGDSAFTFRFMSPVV